MNLCVNNVFRIWQVGQAEKPTQLIFCDLSTPKAAAAAAKDKTAMAAGNKMTGGTELHALENLLEDIRPDPPFSVYEDIRKKLVSMGIPEREIAFIHYVTEGTFDSYRWQTVENKQKFISQIMTSKSPVRS